MNGIDVRGDVNFTSRQQDLIMSDPTEREDLMLKMMKQNAKRIMSTVPWAKALGFELTGIEKGRAFAKVDWREDLVGDPDTGVIHGGVLTALLDDLNTSEAISALHAIAPPLNKPALEQIPPLKAELQAAAHLLALLEADPRAWLQHTKAAADGLDHATIDGLLPERPQA